MKVSAVSLVLAAALGASAHPSGHAHRHMHRSIEERDFIMAQKPAPPAPTTTSTPPPPATSTAAPPPAQSSSSASSSSGGLLGGLLPTFCDGVSKRATAAEIAYTGNIGAPGKYGCNMMLVDSTDGFDYTTTFTNTADEDYSGACWLKIGPDGGINGFFNGNQVLNIDLPAGATKHLAVEKNTQGGCTWGPKTIPLTNIGQFAGTWYEFDFGNLSNDEWTGADASCLVAAKFGLDIPGLKVCGGTTCSTINPGGTGTNAFLAGMEAVDGLGVNLPGGKAHIDVTVGYSG